jgi:hypothetical protein
LAADMSGLHALESMDPPASMLVRMDTDVRARNPG